MLNNGRHKCKDMSMSQLETQSMFRNVRQAPAPGLSQPGAKTRTLQPVDRQQTIGPQTRDDHYRGRRPSLLGARSLTGDRHQDPILPLPRTT